MRVIEATTPRRPALPNILVYADVRVGAPTDSTLFAVSEGRRIARGAGASVFALVATPPIGNPALAALSIPIARAGADKLLLCEADEFAGPPDDATCGRALDAAVARIPPLFVLFPAGGTGRALGPSLAARLGAPYVPACDFVVSDGDARSLRGQGRVQALRLRPDGRSRRRLDPTQIERPIVATLGAGRVPPPAGSDRNLEIDVLPLAPTRTPRPRPAVLSAQPDAHAALALASIVVLVADDEPEAEAIVAALGDVTRPAEPSSTTSRVAIARTARTPAWALAGCCPEIVVKVGRSSVVTGRAPRTRVVLCTSNTDANSAPPEDVDVVWTFGSTAEVVDLVKRLEAEVRP